MTILENDQIPEKDFGATYKEKSQERAIKVTSKKLQSKKFPLKREAIPPKEFPLEALGPILGPAAKKILSVIKCGDAIAANSLLACAAFCVQPFANVILDGRAMPVSLYLLTIAPSGSRKSAVDKLAMKPVRDFEWMLKKTYDEDLQKYKNEIDIWKKQKSKLLNAEEFGQLNLLKEPTAPREPHLVFGEPTFEGLSWLFHVGMPSLMLSTDEGASFLGSHAMNSENFLRMISGLSSFWDGSPVSRIRRGDTNLLLFGKRLNLHLMLQETFVGELFKNKFLLEQGFLARFLVAFPDSPIGSRFYNSKDLSTDTDIIKFWDACIRLLDRKYPLEDETLNVLRPNSLFLSPEATSLWIKFHDHIEWEMRPEGQYGQIVRQGSKGAEQCLRIAAVLSYFENPDITEIGPQYIERASLLTEFYLNEWLRLSETGIVDEDIEIAHKTLDWLKRKFNLNETFHLASILKNGPTKIRHKKDAQRIMGILKEHGHVSEDDDGTWKLVSELL